MQHHYTVTRRRCRRGIEACARACCRRAGVVQYASGRQSHAGSQAAMIAPHARCCMQPSLTCVVFRLGREMYNMWVEWSWQRGITDGVVTAQLSAGAGCSRSTTSMTLCLWTLLPLMTVSIRSLWRVSFLALPMYTLCLLLHGRTTQKWTIAMRTNTHQLFA